MIQTPHPTSHGTLRASLSRPFRMSLAAAVMLLAVLAATVAPVSASGGAPAPETEVEFTLQNYFNAFGDLIPFFDPKTGTIGRGVEVSDDYIYSFDFNRRSITMRWSADPAFDIYEPFVGKAGGFTQEEAAAAPIADEYHFTFNQDLAGYRVVADPKFPLQPNVMIDGNKLVISIPGGTTIGDGIDARFLIVPEKAR